MATRKEKFLKAIAEGNRTVLPNPITREDKYLDQIAKKGLDGIQSDWNQANNTKADFIKNKPVVAIGSADGKEIYLNSSTADSTKVFKITVVDNGTISATEVTE